MISKSIIPISIYSSSASNHYNNNKTGGVVVSRKKDLSSVPKIRSSSRSRPQRRRLVTISTGDGKWQGNWNSQFLISLEDLHLQDLIADHHHHHKEKNAHQVCVSLSVEKHASFGLSVEGRIQSSFPRNCANCFSPYSRKIDTKFNVWILMSNEYDNSDDEQARQLPQIGGDDPSVIYVKPGCEANLDSLIKDTLSLTVSVQDFCSEACENSEPTFQFIGRQSTASIDKRWSTLLDLKNSTNH